jgi:hypothetical protein
MQHFLYVCEQLVQLMIKHNHMAFQEKSETYPLTLHTNNSSLQVMHAVVTKKNESSIDIMQQFHR